MSYMGDINTIKVISDDLIKIVVCDDITEEREQIRLYLDEYFSENEINADIRYYDSAVQMLNETTDKIDIAILDVQMEDISGIQAGYAIHDCNPDAALIIMTSYKQYMDEAMDLRIFRFYEKPVERDRLFSALDIKIKSIIKNKNVYLTESKSDIIAIRENEIVYVASKLRSTEILTSMGQVIVSNLNKKKWIDNLKDNNSFAMPHGSYIVNLNYVRQIGADYIVVECKTGRKEKIFTSRRYSSDFKKAFLKKMEEYK